GCGTCKMRAVLEAPGPVAFVGEGDSDRFGALYADIVFAKDALVAWCERDGVPFVPWEDFDDVRSRLEAALSLPGAVAPERCPGCGCRDPRWPRDSNPRNAFLRLHAFQACPFVRSGRPPGTSLA